MRIIDFESFAECLNRSRNVIQRSALQTGNYVERFDACRKVKLMFERFTIEVYALAVTVQALQQGVDFHEQSGVLRVESVCPAVEHQCLLRRVVRQVKVR